MDEVRKKSEAIVGRAQSDKSFAQKLKDDPEGILRAEGLPDEAIGDFIREAELGEVAGYAMDCTFTCTITTCGVTRRAF
jgi:hypothetical protein